MSTKHFLDNQHSLHALAHQAIHSNPSFLGRDIEVHVQGEGVFLRGRVGSYYQKQLAQETLLEIDAVQSLQNELEVDAAWLR